MAFWIGLYTFVGGVIVASIVELWRPEPEEALPEMIIFHS